MTPCMGLSVINDFSLMSQIVNLSSISLGFICFNKYFDQSVRNVCTKLLSLWLTTVVCLSSSTPHGGLRLNYIGL